MFLTVLGRYGLYPSPKGNTSGYMLSSSGAKVVFEMGSGVLSSLMKFEAPENIDALILSHLHFDHVSDLGVYNYYLESLARVGKLKNKIKLVLPANNNAVREFAVSYSYFEAVYVDDGDEFTVGDICFKFFEVAHPSPCLGFRASCEGRSFVYSGDTNLCDKLEDNLRGADLALLDGAFLEGNYKKEGPHMSAELCSRLSKKYGVRTIVSHILPSVDEKKYLDVIAGNDDCSLAEEGKVYTV